MTVALGSDHAGFLYKEQAKTLLQSMNITFKDFGTDSQTSADYPDYAVLVAKSVLSGETEMGILICGTGIGMSIAANKFHGIRAGVCESVAAAALTRQHNDANILCIGERLTSWETASAIIKTFLTTPFEGGERHCRRVNKLNSLC